MAKKPDVRFGIIVAKRILEREGCGPLRFAELMRILINENPGDRDTRNKVLYWLGVLEDYSIISSDRNEKGIRVYRVSDEKLLRALEEEYQKDTTDTVLVGLVA